MLRHTHTGLFISFCYRRCPCLSAYKHKSWERGRKRLQDLDFLAFQLLLNFGHEIGKVGESVSKLFATRAGPNSGRFNSMTTGLQ